MTKNGDGEKAMPMEILNKINLIRYIERRKKWSHKTAEKGEENIKLSKPAKQSLLDGHKESRRGI